MITKLQRSHLKRRSERKREQRKVILGLDLRVAWARVRWGRESSKEEVALERRRSPQSRRYREERPTTRASGALILTGAPSAISVVTVIEEPREPRARLEQGEVERLQLSAPQIVKERGSDEITFASARVDESSISTRRSRSRPVPETPRPVTATKVSESSSASMTVNGDILQRSGDQNPNTAAPSMQNASSAIFLSDVIAKACRIGRLGRARARKEAEEKKHERSENFIQAVSV